MAEFNPDEYLSGGGAGGFDPDAYLGEPVAVEQSDWMPTEANLAMEQPQKPERTWGDVAEGVGEAALTLGTGATTGTLGFLGGSIEAAIGKLTGGLSEEEAIALIQERAGGLTNMPESEVGQEYVKTIGDTLGVLPPVLGTPAATGLRGVSRFTSKDRAPEARELKSFVSKGFDPKQFKRFKSFSDAQKNEQLNKVLASGDRESLAAMIDADPEYFSAMKELGMKEKGLPSASSRNRQFRETEQALKKIPGSELSKKEFDQVGELQKISDDLITEFGGTTDKSSLSMELLNDSSKAIDDLSITTEAAYKNIGDNIPKQAQSGMDNIGGYVRTELENLGGDKSQLSSLEKRLLAMSENGATYHAVDKIRKEVGNTLNKKSQKYSDEDTGALKNIYAKLTDDQEVVANEFGMSDAWSGAKDLVVMRKKLEDNSIKMFGKNLSDAFMPKMGLAMKKLTDGDYKKFNELMDSVPVNKKQEVIVSALNDAFTMGSRKEKSLNVAGYADWINGLNKNPRLKKEIYSQLPKGLGSKLDAMGKVANGIRNAQAAAPVGGQVMASTKVLDKVVNGFASRFLSKLPGMVGDLVTVGLDKSKSKNMDAALAVIGDPDFVANISALAKGRRKKAEALERNIMNKKSFKDFASTLSPKEMKTIGVLGLTSWLARSEEGNKELTSKESLKNP